jgi:hypothetical protein
MERDGGERAVERDEGRWVERDAEQTFKETERRYTYTTERLPLCPFSRSLYAFAVLGFIQVNDFVAQDKAREREKGRRVDEENRPWRPTTNNASVLSFTRRNRSE